MSLRVATLLAVVAADTRSFDQGMARVEREFMGLDRRSSSTFANIRNSAMQAGRAFTLAFTLPVVGAGAAALKLGADFDGVMRNINSIAELSERQIGDLSKKTLEFGASIRSGPIKAAEALYEVFSAGEVDPARAFEIMTYAVKTAEAGLADLADTTRIFTAVMNSYAGTALTAAEASNVITRMVQLGVGTMDEFANALGYVISSSAFLNIEFRDLGASMAFLTQRGFSTSRAATSLNNILSKLMKPSERLNEVLSELGADSGRQLIASSGGLLPALEKIASAVGYSEIELSKIFTDIRGARAALALVRDMDVTNKMFEEFNRTLNTSTEFAWDEQMKSLSASADLAKASLEAAAITVAQFLMPFAAGGLNLLTNVIHAFLSLDTVTQGFLVGAIAIAAVIPPIIWAFSMLATPIGAVATAIGLVVSAFSADFLGIRSAVEGYLSSLSGLFGELGIAIGNFFNTLFTTEEVTSAPYGIFDNEKFLNESGRAASVIAKQGDTLWGIWNENFRDTPWTEFRDQSGLENPSILRPGDSINVPGGGRSAFTEEELGFQNTTRYIPFYERLIKAFEEQWPAVSQAIMDILTRLWDDISSRFGGLDVRSMLSGFLTSLIDLPRNLAQSFSDVLQSDEGSAIGSIFASIAMWMDTNVIPAFFEGFGYLAGTLLGATYNSFKGIAEGIVSIIQTIFSGGDVGGEIGNIINGVVSNAARNVEAIGRGFNAGLMGQGIDLWGMGNGGPAGSEFTSTLPSSAAMAPSNFATDVGGPGPGGRGSQAGQNSQSTIGLISGYREHGKGRNPVSAKGEGPISDLIHGIIGELEIAWETFWTVTFPDLVLGGINLVLDVLAGFGVTALLVLQKFWTDVGTGFDILWNETLPNIMLGLISWFADNIVTPLIEFGSQINQAFQDFLINPLKELLGLTSQAYGKREGQSELEMRYDGSHKSGLDYVPFDNYTARLHRGEAVLNAQDAAEWRSGSGGSTTINIYEVNDVDRLLFELRRRGIRWDR